VSLYKLSVEGVGGIVFQPTLRGGDLQPSEECGLIALEWMRQHSASTRSSLIE
jgi:hypothetical protein